ncbi:MAG: hypothetical protein GX905_01755 [Bacteroidales bacterium]|nr:hypothetical protein [Bacteroidales bacterium]
MFKMRKPRKYNQQFIYYDERKERLKKMEEDAKRELGMLPPKEFSPDEIRGKFVEASTHLKRRKSKRRKPMHIGVLIIIILILLYLWYFLSTGKLTFF